ncbi:SOSS complex subunit B family protein [Nanoarchaeota archaeon]
MEIKDLQIRQGNVEITADVVDVSPPREFEKFGKKGKVASATIKDATGQVKLSLWNEQADQVKPGQKVKITNGYVNEWQGEPQLTTGKLGKLEVVGEADASAAPPQPETPKEEATSEEPVTEEEDIQ